METFEKSKKNPKNDKKTELTGKEVKRLSSTELAALMEKYPRHVSSIPITTFADAVVASESGNDPFIQKYMGKKIPNNYIPRMQMQPRNVIFDKDTLQIKSIKAFTAAEKKKFGAALKVKGSKRVHFIWPKYWLNHYQYQDYVILQDNYANTIAGRIIDVLVYFTLGNGIKPKLVPKHRDQFKSDEELVKALEDNQWMLDILLAIDRDVSTSSDPQPFKSNEQFQDEYIPFYSDDESKIKNSYDTPLQQKWAAILTLALNFGREVAIPEIDPDDNEVKVQDKTYKNIPKIMKVIHPRDLGFNHVSPRTWKLLGIQLYNSNWILRPDQMMFFEWNPHNPVYGAMYYGFALPQSMIGSARALRRIIEVDFPLIAKTRWSGMYWIFFKRKGEGLMTAEAEHTAILNSIRLDGINISLEDEPNDDVRIERLDLDPKIIELIEMARFLIQYMMAQVGMPQGLMFDEQALNRATLIGKIRSFIQGPIRKYRQWFLEAVSQQWYARMIQTLLPQDERIAKLLEDFDVVADVEDFKLENWPELVQAFLVLSQLNPFKNEEIGKFLNIENYESKIDPDAEKPPLPGGAGGMKITAPDGKEFGVS